MYTKKKNINTNFMINILIKSIMTFILVIFFIRLMGKRQIGEMQPIELVITLIIAEVVCIPMNDPAIPFIAGIIPIVSLSVIEIFIMFLCRKSLFFRKVISGSSVVVIDKQGVNYKNLKSMNMNMNDLLESLRTDGYGDISKVQYAIFETNGKIFVVMKPGAEDDGLLPMPIIIDGKIVKDNFERAGITMPTIHKELAKNGQKLRDILFADIRQNGVMYCSPKNSQYYITKISISGGENW